jgi:translation initiation factor 3 subunit L
MSARNIQDASQQRAAHDDSDADEEVLANNYKESQYHDDDDDDELERVTSSGPQDLQAQLAAAAQPLEYGATLETKISSYDSYCNLFHYILNSDGPVDLEVPNVRADASTKETRTRHH